VRTGAARQQRQVCHRRGPRRLTTRGSAATALRQRDATRRDATGRLGSGAVRVLFGQRRRAWDARALGAAVALRGGAAAGPAGAGAKNRARRRACENSAARPRLAPALLVVPRCTGPRLGAASGRWLRR